MVPASSAHAANHGRSGRGDRARWRVLAERGALLLITVLACFPGFARIFLDAGKRSQRSRFHGGAVLQAHEISRADPRCLSLLGGARRRERSDDLRYKALRDWVVRRHYAHFDYGHARLERATEAREVYLSYRVRDTIFWTRRRIRLHPGELLLTDGKITARARCGNQISDTAKPEVSDEEPDEDILDQPVAGIEAAPSLPIRPMLAPPDLPGGEPIAPKLFAGASSSRTCRSVCRFLPGFATTTTKWLTGICRHKRHKKPVVPEPSTMVLIGSGLALILWRYRRTGRPVTA